MRLIDADKIPYVQDATYMNDYDYAYRYAIEAEPTVDAVPVSYIQQRIDRLRLLAEYEAEANGGYIGRSSMALFELEELIEYWKKEREQNV